MAEEYTELDELTKQLILKEEEKSEKLINYWRFGLSIFFFLITKIISKEIPHNSIVILYGGSAIYFLYSIVMLIYLKMGWYKPSVKYYNMFLDIVLITFIIWMFGTFRTFKTEAFLLYFMWIALGSMRFSLGLTIFTGSLCIAGYMGIIVAGLALGTVETGSITESFTTEKVSLLNQAIKVIYLGLVALGLSYGSYSYMRLARKTLQQELDAERQRLRSQRLESIGFLAGGIAHDFNNILAIVNNNIHIAKLMLADPERALKKLKAAEGAARKATNLTRQLLTFSKGGAPTLKTIDLQEIVEEAAHIALSGTGAKFHLTDPDKNVKAVNADEGQMSQVLNNLLINALQASPDRSAEIEMEIVVTAEIPDDSPLPPAEYVRVRVKDHGQGISAENLQNIFDPYFTTKDTGSGLGLATAYSIIKRHRGYITVDSRAGQGTIFTIYLPYTDDPIESKSIHEPDLPIKKRQILIMDDEEAFVASTGEALMLSGHSVAFASDGFEAIMLYKKFAQQGTPFDVVIMDLNIPEGMGGAEAIAKLREIDPGVCAIVSSGYSNDPVMSDHTAFGFNGILPKPFNMEDMEQEIERALAIKSKKAGA